MQETEKGPGSTATRRIGSYVCAIALPCVTTAITIHSAALANIPMALGFAAIAIIATFFGRGPVIVSILWATLLYNYYILPPKSFWSLSPDAIVSCVILMAVGALIALLNQKTGAAEAELRRALSSLQEKTDALVQAQQGSNSAAWVFNAIDRTTSWYEGGSEIFGRSLSEISALGSPTGLVLEEDRPKIAAAAAHTVQTGEPFRIEFRVAWPNGDVHWLEAVGTPTARNKSQWRGVTTDISARKLAEMALIRSEKLSAAARLAASIAHEINNPLASITNLIYLARQSAADRETSAYLEAAEREAIRIAHVTRQRLRFHKQQSAAAPADIAQELRDLLAFYQAKLTQTNICAELEENGAPPLLCRTGEIRQAMSSLIENAIDAMPGGGRLRIRLRAGTDWRKLAPALRITVADSGSGMVPAVLRRICEPFFTTKEGIGTGLGLWVASEIVQKHGGTLTLRSRTRAPYCGSTFAVTLPYAGPKV